MEGYEECKYLGMIAESARRNMEDNGDLDPILETYVDELRNNPTIINGLKGIKQIQEESAKGQKLMDIFNTIVVVDAGVPINFAQMVQYINAFTFENLAQLQSEMTKIGRIDRLKRPSDSPVEANLSVEADIRDDVLLGSINLHLSGEEDKSALVYEKGIITGIIDRYGEIIEELDTKPSGESEERSSLLVEKTEYIKQKEKLGAYLAKLNQVPEGMQDKGSNKYLASMVLKTLISIMSEELKSLSLILYGDLEEVSGGSFLKGGGEQATQLLSEIREFIDSGIELDSKDKTVITETISELEGMEEDDTEIIEGIREEFESFKLRTQLLSEIREFIDSGIELDSKDKTVITETISELEGMEEDDTEIIEGIREEFESFKTKYSATRPLQEAPTISSQVTPTDVPSTGVTPTGVTPTGGTPTGEIQELKIIHENLISMSRKNKQSGVSYPGKSNCLLKLLQYGSVVALFASLCDLLNIDDLSSEDPIYDREIESYLINGIDMKNLSKITGLKDFVSGNTNDIGIHFLLMKDPTYNNLYNFMKGIVKSYSIGSIFNTFINVNYAMFGGSEQPSSRSGPTQGPPQGPTQGPQQLLLANQQVDGDQQVDGEPQPAEEVDGDPQPEGEVDGSLKPSSGGKRSKRLKRNIRTNKKKSNNKKRRTNNKRSKRNNKQTNHKRSKR